MEEDDIAAPEFRDRYVDYSDEEDDPSYFEMDNEAVQKLRSEVRQEHDNQRRTLDIEWSDEEDDFDDAEFEEEFKLHTGISRGSKGKKKSSSVRLDPQVEQLISHASTAYSRREYELAIELCEEAIKLDGQAKQALVLLAVIYEELNDAEKALIAKVLVMHLDKQNKDGWIEVARLSREAGQFEQALVFYMRAAKLDDQDWDVRFERSLTYSEAGQPARALELLKRIRKNFFPNIPDEDIKKKIILEIAQVMDITGRRSEAISMYEDVFIRNQTGNDPDMEFGWLELNILSELYYKEKEYQRAIRSIKKMSRWILGRGEESWWDDIKDDSEFDEDRRPLIPKFATSPYRNDPARFTLPIDIRARLIYCRLKEGQYNEARVHIAYLRQLDIGELQDIYYSVGESLEEVSLWAEALEIFQLLEKVVQDAPPLLTHIAKCLTLLSDEGDLERAEDMYQRAITFADGDDNFLDVQIEAMIGLAEIYGATHRTDEAKELVQEVYQLREYSREKKQHQERGEESIALIPNTRAKAKHPHRRLTREEKIEAEKQAERLAEEQYSKLIRYQDGVEKGNPISVAEWTDAASILINMFCSIKKFFPTDRSKIFTGLKVHRPKKDRDDTDLDERLSRLNTRINENELAGSDVEDSIPDQVSTQFHGISFDDWFNTFVQYALLLAHTDPEMSYLVLKSARGASVFHMNNTTLNDDILWRVHISCAFIAQDYSTANEVIRQYLNIHQFSNDALRLYGAVLSSGNAACEIFNGNNNQKFFLRQLKAIDSLVSGKRVDGAAKIADTSMSLTKENPLLLVLYAHIMLLGRSYVLCLNYLLKAFKTAPNDTMILLTLGCVHIHRAMQRQTTNRHLQVVEGFSYLMDYYEVRSKAGLGEAQEAAYNLGRAFHMLGLSSLAAVYYEKVLEIDYRNETYDLSKEAAYNLHLIYTISGNPRLAQSVVDQYLVI